MSKLKNLIEKCWKKRELLDNIEYQDAIKSVIEKLDSGDIRVAELIDQKWITNEWVKKLLLCTFQYKRWKLKKLVFLNFMIKMKLKKGYAKKGVRVVPHAIARYGSYLARGVIMMPSYVNIGAYVDENTMIDTWATVGSCAKLEKMFIFQGE